MKIFKILAVNICVLVTIVMVTIVAIYFHGNSKIKKERKELQNAESKKHYQYDQALGYKLKPSQTFTLEALTHQSEDSNKIFSIDKFGRRINPIDTSRDAHLLFFGGSYTFGDGLDDSETLPYIFQNYQDSFNCYNYAFSGYGTAQVNVLLENGIKTQINEQSGVALYLFINHHINRSVFDWYNMQWAYDFPEYAIENNTLLYKGSFYDNHKYAATFWKGFGDWKLWPIFMPILNKFFANEMDNLNSKHGQLTAKIIDMARKSYLEQFPNGQFITVIYPDNKNQIISYLKKENLSFIDLSDQVDLKSIAGIQSDGYHPNGTGNLEMAKILNQYLHGELKEEVFFESN